MLVTSRPNALNEELFKQHFHRVYLDSLTLEQQQDVIRRRVTDASQATKLLDYVEHQVPHDTETGKLVTGNPLMLSMIISLFQINQGALPTSLTEVYRSATDAMLNRVDFKGRGTAVAAATVPHLTALLERTFFEAHVRTERVISDHHLAEAANQVKAAVADVAAPNEVEQALETLRQRVEQDRLPLLSLLEPDPLRVQSSHLSFQEYFTARAICKRDTRLPDGCLPWKAWWNNALKLGLDMGDAFVSGLKHAANVDDELKVSVSRGERISPAGAMAVAALCSSKLHPLTSLDISGSGLDAEGAKHIADSLRVNASLTQVLAFCRTCGHSLNMLLALQSLRPSCPCTGESGWKCAVWHRR